MFTQSWADAFTKYYAKWSIMMTSLLIIHSLSYLYNALVIVRKAMCEHNMCNIYVYFPLLQNMLLLYFNSFFLFHFHFSIYSH